MNITGEQKLLAILAHLAYLLGGLGFIIAPLVIFLLRKEDPFVYHHAKQALVAHLAILAASVITSLLCILLIGFLAASAHYLHYRCRKISRWSVL